jgi:hypothetical protein
MPLHQDNPKRIERRSVRLVGLPHNREDLMVQRILVRNGVTRDLVAPEAGGDHH